MGGNEEALVSTRGALVDLGMNLKTTERLQASDVALCPGVLLCTF